MTKDLISALGNDPSFRLSWEANIAMSFKDCAYQYKKKTGKKYLTQLDLHIVANNAANYFIDLLCSDHEEN